MDTRRFLGKTRVAAIIAMVGSQTLAGEPSGLWVRVTEHAAFSPRDTSEDAVFGGRLWLSNAYHNGNKLVRDLWSSKDGAAWTCVSTNTPYDGYSEMAVFNGKLWAVKGSVWNSTDGMRWTQVLEKTPFGVRGYGELVVYDGKLWQLGSGADVWNSTDGARWDCVTKAAAYGNRAAAAVAVYKGKLWLNGGRTHEPSDPPEKHYPKITTHNDVWCSTDGARWTRVLERAPWAARQWFIGREYAGKLWIIGGFDNRNGKNFGDVWFTEDGVTWKELVSGPRFSPRHEPTVYVFDNSLWVVAGNAWPLVNDVWRLTLK
jgi:hypothetical protein